jgi:HK97 family phage major capsid protein
MSSHSPAVAKAAQYLTPDEHARFTGYMADETRSRTADEASDFKALVDKVEFGTRVDAIRNTHVNAPTIRTTSSTFSGDIRSAKSGELRDAALTLLDGAQRSLAPRQLDHVDQLLRQRDGTARTIAQMTVLTESDEYRSAWQKAVTGNTLTLSEPERNALAQYNEFRAANEGSPGSAGGYGVPVLIDPTIILTSGAVDAPVLDISRVVTVTTDAWKGVTSAAVSWSYDSEASAVSDDAPTVAQPNIPVYSARGYVPFSIEIGQDYPNFADEMSNLLAQGYVDLLASQTVVGSGSSSPRGIFTAMSATTTNPAHLTVTTAGSIDGAALRKTWAALPERFRQRATWLLSPGVDAQVRGLGNNLALADYTVNITADGNSILFGRPVVLSDYAPGFAGTTGVANYAVVGDFSTGFVIAQRAGMTVELVPQVFDTSTGRPTGQRGWFAYTRHGFDVVNANAFRVLANS